MQHLPFLQNIKRLALFDLSVLSSYPTLYTCTPNNPFCTRPRHRSTSKSRHIQMYTYRTRSVGSAGAVPNSAPVQTNLAGEGSTFDTHCSMQCCWCWGPKASKALSRSPEVSVFLTHTPFGGKGTAVEVPITVMLNNYRTPAKAYSRCIQ